ncbi:MAG: hypothetical protein QM718_08735 [Steroidobacteraceae bacterium]
MASASEDQMTALQAAKRIVAIYVDLGKLPGDPVIAGAMAAQFVLRGFERRHFACGIDCAVEQGWLASHEQEQAYSLTHAALPAR